MCKYNYMGNTKLKEPFSTLILSHFYCIAGKCERARREGGGVANDGERSKVVEEEIDGIGDCFIGTVRVLVAPVKLRTSALY